MKMVVRSQVLICPRWSYDLVPGYSRLRHQSILRCSRPCAWANWILETKHIGLHAAALIVKKVVLPGVTLCWLSTITEVSMRHRSRLVLSLRQYVLDSSNSWCPFTRTFSIFVESAIFDGTLGCRCRSEAVPLYPWIPINEPVEFREPASPLFEFADLILQGKNLVRHTNAKECCC